MSTTIAKPQIEIDQEVKELVEQGNGALCDRSLPLFCRRNERCKDLAQHLSYT